MESSTPYFDAALRWFAGNQSVQQARDLIDGKATEAMLWRSFEGFGLAELLDHENEPRERARIVAEVGRAAGRSLYTGPLAPPPESLAGGTALADGTVSGWQAARSTSMDDQWSHDTSRVDDISLLATCARLQGVGETVLALTIEQLSTRRQFGRTLASFQALQHATVDRHCDLVLTASLLNQVALHWANEPLRRTALHALKATVGPAAVAACDHAVQMFGAMGFTHECDIGLYLRHALVLAARHGTSAAHRARYASNRVDFLQA